MILKSLNSPKLLQEDPESLVKIMREFSHKRFQKPFVHVHTLPSRNAAFAGDASLKAREMDDEV